jgi:prepilin-type N-terminal cleavage/methylation domain-containing protein
MALRQSAIRNPQSAMGLRRRGFSFVEVLFAVMILGIGFILIAGVFPVAISQTQTNGEETVGAAIGRNAVAYLSQIPVTGNVTYDQSNQNGWIATQPWPGAMRDDGRVHAIFPRSDWPLNGSVGPPFWDGDIPLWHVTKGNMVQPDDPRFAWVAYYRRTQIPPVPPSTTPTPAGFAQVIVVACRNRAEDLYDGRMDAAPSTLINPYPVPKLVQAQFNANSSPDQPDQIQFSSSTGAQAAVAPGTFVVIANDTTVTPPGPNPPPKANGWVLRVGNQVVNASGNPIPDQWELLPGNDFKNIPPPGVPPTAPQFYKPTQADVYIIGQAFDPSKKAYVGGTQDVSVYTTFILLK